MANANRPMGLIPTVHINGAPYNGQANIYTILAANVNSFAIGDPVATDPGGGSGRGIAAVTLAAATGAIRGVVVGIGDTYPFVKVDNPNSIIRPAGAQTKDWYVMVVDSPDVIFEIQEPATLPSLGVADIGLNTNLLPGANNGFISGWQLDNASEGNTADLQVRLMGLVQRQENAVGPYAKWLVKINNHELSAGTAGA